MKKIGFIFCLLSIPLFLSGCDSYSDSSSQIGDCSDEQDKIEELENRISVLEECNADFNYRLREINDEAGSNAWLDYNAMGDSLDNIEYTSASFNVSSNCD